MERVTITINTTNDAFGDIPELANYELARIINKLAFIFLLKNGYRMCFWTRILLFIHTWQ